MIQTEEIEATWKTLFSEGVIEITGTDKDVRPRFVGLQGIIEMKSSETIPIIFLTALSSAQSSPWNSLERLIFSKMLQGKLSFSRSK